MTLTQQRHGRAAEWMIANPILAPGELGIETDTSWVKVGNGITPWASLLYIASGNAATATKLATARNINGVPFDGSAAITITDATAEKTANKNTANGYAGLDSGGKLPAILWPAGIDEILEYANLAAFPGTGASQIIYLALDTGKEYRWSGSTYVEISPSPGSTDSVVEGSTNLYYTNARADARVAAGNAATATKLATARNIAGVSFDGSAAINLTQDNIGDGTTNRSFTAAEKTKLGAISGTNTGDQTSVSGNAGTATKLATARNINGVAFDGSADISLDAHNDARYEPLEAFVILQSAYTLTSQTAAQQLFNTTTNGAITLPLGDYFFECLFTLTGMSSTSGSFGFGFGGSAAITQNWIAIAGKGVSLGAVAEVMTWGTASVTALIASNVNTNGIALVKGRITVTTAGTLIPQTSLTVAAAAIVGAGAFFRIQGVNSTAAFAGSWS